MLYIQQGKKRIYRLCLEKHITFSFLRVILTNTGLTYQKTRLLFVVVSFYFYLFLFIFLFIFPSPQKGHVCSYKRHRKLERNEERIKSISENHRAKARPFIIRLQSISEYLILYLRIAREIADLLDSTGRWISS